MNTEFYSDAKQTANELLEFFGKKALISNPENRGTASGLAVIVTPKIESPDGTYVMSTEKVVYFQAVGNFTPEAGGVITFGKNKYVISAIDSINPDDSTPILFKLMVNV